MASIPVNYELVILLKSNQIFWCGLIFLIMSGGCSYYEVGASESFV